MKLYLWDIDFIKFSDQLCRCAEGIRFRTYYYDGRFENIHNSQQYNFSQEEQLKQNLEKLSNRFITRWGRARFNVTYSRYQQKGVDILLAIDLTEISVSRSIDRVILVISDTDFIPAITKARNYFTLVTFAYFHEEGVSPKIKAVCDDSFEITDEMIKQSLNKS